VSEFLLFSDFHAHNFRYGSYRVPFDGREGLYNSRLIDAIEVLRQIDAYADDNGIPLILFGGDLFHKRQHVSTEVFNLVHSQLCHMARNKKLLLVPGNHDYADRAGNIHSLEPFRGETNIEVSTGGLHSFKDFAVCALPYDDDKTTIVASLEKLGDLAEAQEVPTILLAHTGIQGARVGSDYVLVADHDIQVSDVPRDKFLGCFFGHYHQHQQVFSNGWFIGATHQHNWGDAGTTRGFLHASIRDGQLSFVQVPTVAPCFVKTDVSQLSKVASKDFVRVSVSSSESVDALGDLDFASLEVIREAGYTNTAVPESALNAQELIESWVSLNYNGANSPSLIDLGKTLLAKAEDKLL
jgi:DNA repair exonuclease SbcCD nuclease subunit